jgi:hypothetical protein
VLAVGLILSIPLSLALAELLTAPLGLSSHSALGSAYGTMWQVQGAVAAIALPILLFVIQLSGERRDLAARTAEVLIRQSWAFFIIAFSLLGTVRIGVDVAWWGTSASVFALDLTLIFALTIALALWAYLRVLQLLFRPALLKEKSLDLSRERMSRTQESSIRLRLGNNMLLRGLAAAGIRYWPFPTRRRERRSY